MINQVPGARTTFQFQVFIISGWILLSLFIRFIPSFSNRVFFALLLTIFLSMHLFPMYVYYVGAGLWTNYPCVQAGFSAAPTRAISSIKNMNIPQQIKEAYSILFFL